MGGQDDVIGQGGHTTLREKIQGFQGDFYQFFKEILPFTGKFWKKFQEFQGDFVSICVKIVNRGKKLKYYYGILIRVMQLVQSCAYCTLEVNGHDCTS